MRCDPIHLPISHILYSGISYKEKSYTVYISNLISSLCFYGKNWVNLFIKSSAKAWIINSEVITYEHKVLCFLSCTSWSLMYFSYFFHSWWSLPLLPMSIPNCRPISIWPVHNITEQRSVLHGNTFALVETLLQFFSKWLKETCFVGACVN